MLTGSRVDKNSLRRIDPMAIWRWGFSAVMIGCGIWLVIAAPQLGGASGRTIGLIVIAYACVRLTFGWFMRKRDNGF